MDANVKQLKNSEIEIEVELTKDEFQKYIDEAAEEISKQANISGFRSGKVPYDVLVKHVGEEVIMNHALDIALPQVLTEVVKKEKLDIIARPKVDVVSTDPLKIKAIASIYPKVKVDGYDKIKVKADDVKVTDKDVDEAIENVKKQFINWDEVEEKAAKGDKVEIDFEGFDSGGASLEGTKSKNHPMVLGEGMMIPGFEDNVIGLKKDDEKEFKIKFPKDYHKKSFQEKEVNFKLKVIKVFKAEYPTLDEAFIEKLIGQKKSVEEFKKDVENDLLQYKKGEARKKTERQFLEKVLDITKFDVSEILVDEELQHMIAEMKHDMTQKGLKYDDYLKQMKKTEDDIKKELKPEAEKRIKIRFGMHEIMEKEDIKPDEEKVKQAMSRMGDIPKDRERQLRAQVENSIRIEELFDRFLK